MRISISGKNLEVSDYMRETAENVRAAADEYRTVDEGNSDVFRRLQA